MNRRIKMPMFKPVFIEGTTLGDTWHTLLWELYHKGRKYLITKGSFEGTYRYAFDFVSGMIHFPHERPLAPIMPEGSNLPSPTDEQSIENYFINYLMRKDLEIHEHYTYGGYINGNPKLCNLNQLEWIIKHFKKVGFGTEHCYISIGNGSDLLNYDEPYINDQDRKTTACLRGLDFRIIKENDINYLITVGYWRSWDIIAFPENIGGIILLNEFVSQELDIKSGPICFSSKNLHAYEHAFNYIKQRLGK
jgi:hypothetical protein